MNDSKSAEAIERFRIREVVERYCTGITRRDWDAIASVYAEDATFEELPPIALTFRGRADILDGVRHAIEAMHLLVFMMHSCVVELDGERARSKSVIHEFGFLTVDESTKIEMYGIYDDEFVKRNDQWQFINRVFRPIWWRLPPQTLNEVSR